MEIFGIILAGIFGAIFGSYSTLFAYRLPIGESCFGRYFGPKSRCPKCSAVIKTRDLIPIFNWFFTKGKCRKCHTPIPRTYLFIEIATTILFMICYEKFSFSEEFIIYALMSAALVIMIVTDYSHKIFPNEVLAAFLMTGLVNRVLQDDGIIDAIFSAAIGVIFATIFYKIFYKKFSGFLANQKQSLSCAKFIIIASIYLVPTLFLLYFLALLAILTSLILLDKSLKRKNSSLGFSMILPFIWLMFYPPF